MVTRAWPKEYGCSRLFSAQHESTGVLGFQFRSSWGSGVLGLTTVHRARAFSALPPLITRLGHSRLYSRSQSSGVLGSASAHHKARPFSALFTFTELGRSRLCLRKSYPKLQARFKSCASWLRFRKPRRPILASRFACDGPPVNRTTLPPSVTSRIRVCAGLSEYRATVPSRDPRIDVTHAFRNPVTAALKTLSAVSTVCKYIVNIV